VRRDHSHGPSSGSLQITALMRDFRCSPLSVHKLAPPTSKRAPSLFHPSTLSPTDTYIASQHLKPHPNPPHPPPQKKKPGESLAARPLVPRATLNRESHPFVPFGLVELKPL